MNIFRYSNGETAFHDTKNNKVEVVKDRNLQRVIEKINGKGSHVTKGVTVNNNALDPRQVKG